MGPVFTLCFPAGLVRMRSLTASGRPTAPTTSSPTPKAPLQISGHCLIATASSAKASPTPVQLTTGPLAFDHALPSQDGHKIFVTGLQARGELVRYDSRARQFLPFLSGISVDQVDFSPDGQWVTYVTVPEGTLWRSRVDGSERLQLTNAPMFAILPRWSPDGKQIVFSAGQFGKPCEDFSGIGARRHRPGTTFGEPQRDGSHLVARWQAYRLWTSGVRGRPRYRSSGFADAPGFCPARVPRHLQSTLVARWPLSGGGWQRLEKAGAFRFPDPKVDRLGDPDH